MKLYAKTVLVSLLGYLGFAGCAGIISDSELSREQRRSNLASFDYVWTTIRDQHYDPEIGGADWAAVIWRQGCTSPAW